MSRNLARTIAIAIFSMLGLASPGRGASIYVDYLVTGGNGSPSSGFGAALGIPGQWNSLDFSSSNVPVVDTTGGATPVAISNLAGGQAADHASTSGDVQLLLDDGLDSSSSFNITISGLAAGAYRLYIYAWHPATAGDQVATQITVDGHDAQTVQRTSGFLAFGAGETHSLHHVIVDTGEDVSITATAAGAIPAAIVNGFQIVPVPEPSTLALGWLGAVFFAGLAWKRR